MSQTDKYNNAYFSSLRVPARYALNTEKNQNEFSHHFQYHKLQGHTQFPGTLCHHQPQQKQQQLKPVIEA